MMLFWIFVMFYGCVFTGVSVLLQEIIGVYLPNIVNSAIGAFVVFPVSFIMATITANWMEDK